MSLLHVKDVHYRYEGAKNTVLKDINATFEKGKIYAIVGKSGSGKTTLLSLLAGLDICTEGEIVYNGQNLKKIDRDNYRAKSIGVVFQGYNLLINVTAVDNVMLSMNISGVAVRDKKEYVYQLLENVGINRDTANRKVLKLSGGEQQRVGIARALSHTPDIVIADEPTGNLDSKTENGIMNIFTNLAHQEDKCVIIVTHSKSVASYADEILGIKDGKMQLVK
ncbi:ABC transporter ATP-binding protein [Neobacillus sp. WH10]|uniref:ABC transporter ATP-binding protein n=1 Tax=Neobacillus sp. WH10 TaxID=3047873 RepID=UPI0024C10317|nr:ABC transporter ATP-binding protein [Neobacillus sp. WH10]WHY79761.1 ABC transporter ATP-binding protein [Neobacillus sp. WH10]